MIRLFHLLYYKETLRNLLGVYEISLYQAWISLHSCFNSYNFCNKCTRWKVLSLLNTIRTVTSIHKFFLDRKNIIIEGDLDPDNFKGFCIFQYSYSL
ncbi:unnamed protein product [Moneuplotes crassus]|uniref:Uncharacterized protein n=1 Tax=Euplotes crassus TaxID=5936 RepID=A0AAD1Y5R2_EUPCR|nr:unnamed protein product [Moneuplotes crassus]